MVLLLYSLAIIYQVKSVARLSSKLCECLIKLICEEILIEHKFEIEVISTVKNQVLTKFDKK